MLPDPESTASGLAPQRHESVPIAPTPVSIVEQSLLHEPGGEASPVGRLETPLDPNLPPPLPEASSSEMPVVPPILASLPVLTPISVSSADPTIWLPSPFEYWKKAVEFCSAVRRGSIQMGEVSHITNRMKAHLASGRQGLLAFSGDTGFVLQKQVPPDSDVWFIGDIHGDMLAFSALTDYARETSKRNQRTPFFFFLGDLFDDGDLAHGVLVGFFSLLLEFPKQVAFVAGNHDVGLSCDAQSNLFKSSVTPSDFADWLNAPTTGGEWRELAQVAIAFFRVAPRAVLLPDGTLVSHGGIPLTDRHEKIGKVEDLSSEECLEDFVWTRAHETARRKIPNRSTRGCSFGYQDFDEFCDLTAKFLSPPVRQLIRGHDHVPERWQLPPKYALHPLLTINAMSWRQRDLFGPFERKPVIARWVRDQLPEVHQIEIPAGVIREIYETPSPA